MKIYLSADYINGVCIVDKDDIEGEPLPQELFYELLYENDVETPFYTCCDEQTFLKIKEEYGICNYKK